MLVISVSEEKNVNVCVEGKRIFPPAEPSLLLRKAKSSSGRCMSLYSRVAGVVVLYYSRVNTAVSSHD